MTLRYRAAIADGLRTLDAPQPHVAPTEHAVLYRVRWGRGIAPLADIYLPARATTRASAVLVHGGAFVIGSRRMRAMRFLAARLSAAGIATCAVDYRLIFRGGRLDEAVTDVCDAVAFWRARAAALALDPDRVSLIGVSAGASLGLLAAARAPGIAAVACCFGLYELDHLRGIAGVLPRLLVRATPWDDQLAAQPRVPTMLLHGDADALVPVEQARRLAGYRAALGLPTRLVIYPGAPHGFFNAPSPACEAAVGELVAQVVRC